MRWILIGLVILVLANGGISMPSMPDLSLSLPGGTTTERARVLPGLSVERERVPSSLNADASGQDDAWTYKDTERVYVTVRPDLVERYEGRTMTFGCGDAQGRRLVRDRVEVGERVALSLGSVARMRAVEHCMLLDGKRVVARSTRRGIAG